MKQGMTFGKLFASVVKHVEAYADRLQREIWTEEKQESLCEQEYLMNRVSNMKKEVRMMRAFLDYIRRFGEK